MYTAIIVSTDISNPIVHICQLTAENKPGRIIEILRGIEARKHLWEIEKEIDLYLEWVKIDMGKDNSD